MWPLPRELLWAIIVSLSISVIAIWPSERSLHQDPGIDSKEQFDGMVRSYDTVNHGRSGEVDREIAILGIRLGEWLLGIATWMLWLATARLVRGAEIAAQHQLRAYISISPQRRDVPDINVFTGVINTSIVIKNVGQTPAKGMLHWSGNGIHEFPQPTLRVPAENELTMAARVTVFPGQDVRSPVERTLTQEELNSIRNNDSAFRFYIWGEVIYFDIFGVERHTKYRLDFGSEEGFRHGALRWSHYGNETD